MSWPLRGVSVADAQQRQCRRARAPARGRRRVGARPDHQDPVGPTPKSASPAPWPAGDDHADLPRPARAARSVPAHPQPQGRRPVSSASGWWTSATQIQPLPSRSRLRRAGRRRPDRRPGQSPVRISRQRSTGFFSPRPWIGNGNEPSSDTTSTRQPRSRRPSTDPAVVAVAAGSRLEIAGDQEGQRALNAHQPAGAGRRALVRRPTPRATRAASPAGFDVAARRLQARRAACAAATRSKIDAAP